LLFGNHTKRSERQLRVATIRVMPDPFESAHRKIARASKHFDDLEREVVAFLGEDPYRQVIEIDPDNAEQLLHKFKLVKSFEDRPIPEIIGDIVSNLRAALDHAIYATAIMSGCQKPGFDTACFPFAGGADRFENTFKGRCKDVSTEMYPLLRSFQPYKGGNRLLAALQALRNADNHAVLTPFGTDFDRPFTSVKTIGYASMIVPEHSTWDRAKQEVIYLKTRTDTEVQYEINFQFFVAFDNIEIIAGRSVLVELDAIGVEVERVVSAIQAESCRLGFCQ